MKYIVICLFLFTSNEALSQRYYLTKDAVTKLTKKMNYYKSIESKLVLATSQIESLSYQITVRDSILYNDRMIFDSIMRIKNSKIKELTEKYESALKQVPRRKRKFL